jgi:flagellar export protein FliJ
MTQRRARVRKVIALRERELDGRVQKLGEARAHAERIEAEERRVADEVKKASNERAELAQRPMSAAEWREANEWLASRERSHLAATVAVKRASEHVEHSQHGVLTARTALKGVERLDEKLLAQELKEEDRASRKLEDELARGRVQNREPGRNS